MIEDKMSRQMVLTRRGRQVGYIDTAPDGKQSAICQRGTLVGIFHPATGETVAPTGGVIADGNRLTEMLQQTC